MRAAYLVIPLLLAGCNGTDSSATQTCIQASQFSNVDSSDSLNSLWKCTNPDKSGTFFGFMNASQLCVSDFDSAGNTSSGDCSYKWIISGCAQIIMSKNGANLIELDSLSFSSQTHFTTTVKALVGNAGTINGICGKSLD